MASVAELQAATAEVSPPVRVVSLRESLVAGLDLTNAVRLLIAASWFAWAQLWAQDIGLSSFAPELSLFALLGGLAIVATTAASWTTQRWRHTDLLILAGTLLIVGLWLIARAPVHGYGSDEITTGQASATVLLSGHNPYGADLTEQLKAFHLPPQVSTPLLNGGVVHTTSYPALSFLLYVPFGAVLGVGAPYAMVADIAGWMVLMVLMWRLLDPRLRPLVPLVASAFFYVGLVDGGDTDSLFLPFMCIALYRWDRFVLPDVRPWLRWAGPIALGLACSTKPLPWLIAPFLVVAVSMEAGFRRRSPLRTAASYCAVVLAVFAAVNGPFIVLNAGAWVRGALLPLTQPLIPFGEGIVQLPLSMHIAGGHLGYLMPAAFGAMVAGLGVLVATFPRSRRMLPLLATVPLVLSSRSLMNYFGCLVILMLVGAVGNDPAVAASTARLAQRLRLAGRAVACAGMAVAGAATMAFLLSPAPVRLAVTANGNVVDSTGHVSVVLTVVASNLTAAPITPAFAITSGGYVNAAWRATTGPTTLAPHSTATYTLLATDPRTTLPPGSVFIVDALAVGPASLSTSAWVTAT